MLDQILVQADANGPAQSVILLADNFFCSLLLLISFVLLTSIKHEYSEWDEKNPRLVTCNANTKIAPGSHARQEVSDDAYIVFTYDVTFVVCNVSKTIIIFLPL